MRSACRSSDKPWSVPPSMEQRARAPSVVTQDPKSTLLVNHDAKGWNRVIAPAWKGVSRLQRSLSSHQVYPLVTILKPCSAPDHPVACAMGVHPGIATVNVDASIHKELDSDIVPISSCKRNVVVGLLVHIQVYSTGRLPFIRFSPS